MNTKTFGVIAFLMIAAQVSLLGFGIWVIVKLMQHFGVI